MEDIIIDMNSTLDYKTVKTIITKYIEEQTGKTICEIVPIIDKENLSGFKIIYQSEHSSYYVGSNDKVNRPHLVDKTFKPMAFY
jgi:hypothetical protein